jgi:hypothetical protein
MPAEAKAALPQLDWATQQLRGYEVNGDAGELQAGRQANCKYSSVSPSSVPALPPHLYMPACAEGNIVREAHIMQWRTPDDSPVWPAEEMAPGFKCAAMLTVLCLAMRCACSSAPRRLRPASSLLPRERSGSTPGRRTRSSARLRCRWCSAS